MKPFILVTKNKDFVEKRIKETISKETSKMERKELLMSLAIMKVIY